MDERWQATLPRLREVVGERNFSMWIEPIRCERDREGYRLEVPSRFYQDWITRHFLETISRLLAEAPGEPPTLRVVVNAPPRSERPRARGARETRLEPAPPPGVRRSRAARVGRLVAGYSFETFVVGPSNEVAVRAARDVVEDPGRRYNPFFLWGGVGLGKTHLVNAIGHEMLQRSGRVRVGCLSAESFMNSMIAALRQDEMNAFRARFRQLDVLILDDVQFLAGKERTQEEFFHTFEALSMAHRQIVLTSDKPPHAIRELEQRLRSRFEGGLIADVLPPTLEMRVEIVLQKACKQGLEISPEVAEVLAHRSGPSVRELEGALTRVLATAALEGSTISLSTVDKVLRPLPPAARRSLSVEEVQERVARHFGLTAGDLQSRRRDRAVGLPRQIAMLLSRSLSEASLASIAEKFGGRDHTTVLYSLRTIEERCRKEEETRRLLETLRRQLAAPLP